MSGAREKLIDQWVESAIWVLAGGETPPPPRESMIQLCARLLESGELPHLAKKIAEAEKA